MFDDCTTVKKMSGDKSKEEDYAIHNGELEQKCFIAWSPLEENKFLFKHRYVSCSRSVPRRNKRFVRYRISRSLNFDTSVRSSSTENSSFEEDKHLSRSAKIMRALNFNSSPSYYGKTKIKKSLNFNLSPSPKRFIPSNKSIRKSLSLNFKSPLSVSNKFLHFDDNPSDSVNSHLLFSSSESIDENQNETPLQQNTKEHEMLLYSTPNTKLSRKALCTNSFTPLLRSRLKETIDNIVCVDATPNAQSLQHTKGRSKCTNGIAMNTSRNLFYEFYDKEDDRPCTPENVICIIPESMSAIKRSHKKERSSRRNEHCAVQCTSKFKNGECVLQDMSSPLLTRHKRHTEPLEDSKSNIDRYCNAISISKELSLSHSEDNISDTGSLFDYTGEQESISKECKEESGCVSNYNNLSKIHKTDIHVKAEVHVESSSTLLTLGENELLQDYSNVDESSSSNEGIDLASNTRSVTPDPCPEVALESQKAVTPENYINILQQVANDSIKKSHKKTKDNNKRRLFSPKVLHGNLEATETPERMNCWQTVEQSENIDKNNTTLEQSCFNAPGGKRSCTPEKVKSSRLLLSQFSSVKKSHKKDKHNKILCEFLKRQEYFGKDVDSVKNSRYKAFDVADVSDCKDSIGDLSSDLDVTTNNHDYSLCSDQNTSMEKLSPSKRKKTLNLSLDREASVSSDSELQELDTSKEEFQIFTPLKRKRSVITSTAVKERLHFYDVPSEKSDHSEDSDANISFSRCLTPIPKFQSVHVKTEDTDITAIKSEDNISSEKEVDYCSNDVTGRLTPRDMSTIELYVNLDSIKKSHKKNKRGNSSRKGFSIVQDDSPVEERNGLSMESSECETYNSLDVSNYCVAINDNDIDIDIDINKSTSDKPVDYGNIRGSSASPATDSEGHASPIQERSVLSNVTPPNCLKTKNYMRLLRETSIKRSHKKVRDQKKQEFTDDAGELSDDGSIFGDEKNLDFIENQSTHD